MVELTSDTPFARIGQHRPEQHHLTKIFQSLRIEFPHVMEPRHTAPWSRLPVQLRLNIDLLYLASPPPSFTLVSNKTHDTFQRTIYVKQDWLMWVSAFIATWDKMLFIYMYHTSTTAPLINKQWTGDAMRREEHCLQESHISLWVTKNSL
jgi:hypothetical protein